MSRLLLADAEHTGLASVLFEVVHPKHGLILPACRVAVLLSLCSAPSELECRLAVE